jgi:hypothetical protein
MIHKCTPAAFGKNSDSRYSRVVCSSSNTSAFSGRTSLLKILSCNLVVFVVFFLCFTGVISNIFSPDNGRQSSVYILMDDLCKEADSGDSDKSQLLRIDGSFVAGALHIKQNESFCIRFIVPDLPFQTFHLFSLPAGRSPPC